MLSMIPNWSEPSAIKGKDGYYLDYYKETFQGIPLGFFVTSYMFDDYYKFDTCAANKNLDINAHTKDLKDLDSA